MKKSPLEYLNSRDSGTTHKTPDCSASVFWNEREERRKRNEVSVSPVLARETIERWEDGAVELSSAKGRNDVEGARPGRLPSIHFLNWRDHQNHKKGRVEAEFEYQNIFLPTSTQVICVLV